MQSKSMKAVLAAVVCLAMLATGCTAQWISVALADLPVLTQMALNIASLVATVQGQRMSPGETAGIQSLSSSAYGALNSLQTLYQQYEANPDAGTLQKIQDVIAEAGRELPAELQAAHISDPALSARVTAAVNLIVSTMESFAAMMPSAAPTARRLEVRKAGELKSRWNREVCGVESGCMLR